MKAAGGDGRGGLRRGHAPRGPLRFTWRFRGSYKWFRVLGLRVISPLVWVISIVTLLITLRITTHEPPSRASRLRLRNFRYKVQGFLKTVAGGVLGSAGFGVTTFTACCRYSNNLARVTTGTTTSSATTTAAAC